MSAQTSSPPEAIRVPPEFVPVLVDFASLGVGCKGDMSLKLSTWGGSRSLDADDRAEDDAIVAEMLQALDVRAALLRALDHGEPVPVTPPLGDVVKGAIDDVAERLGEDARKITAAAVLSRARLLAGLCAWAHENGIVAPDAVTVAPEAVTA